MHLATPDCHGALLPRLTGIPFNTYFAEAVLRGLASGHVYLDRDDSPETFLIANRCGMSLLAGNPGDEGSRSWFQDYALNAAGTRQQIELVQPHPSGWVNMLAARLGGRFQPVPAPDGKPGGGGESSVRATSKENVVAYARLNFAFSPELFSALPPRPLHRGMSVSKLDGSEYAAWAGDVMPREFWEDDLQYTREAQAFGVHFNGQLVSLAFSAFRFRNIAEIGIETKAPYRKLGLGWHAAHALITACLQQGIEPVWSCKKGNLGSLRAAESLGFVLTQEIPYLSLVVG